MAEVDAAVDGPTPEVMAQVDSALSKISDLYRALPGASAFLARSEKRYVSQTIVDRYSEELTEAEAEEFLVWANSFFTKLGQYIEETVERVTFDKWPGMEAIVNSDMGVEEQTEAIAEMVRGAKEEASEMEEDFALPTDESMVSINSITESFEPSIDRVEINYSIKEDPAYPYARMQITHFGIAPIKVAEFDDLSKGADITFKDPRDDEEGWSGLDTYDVFVGSGNFQVKIQLSSVSDFSDGYQATALVSGAGTYEVYDYVVSDPDAWYRSKEDPYSTITPTPRTDIIPQGLQVAVLDIVPGGDDKEVAKMKYKSTGQIEYTTLTNVTRIKSLEKELQYKVLKDFQALKLPYGKKIAGKEYKVGDQITVYKECADYVKVKGEGGDYEGHWVLREMLSEFMDLSDVESLHFIASSDVWLRKPTAPLEFTKPTKRATKGTHVAKIKELDGGKVAQLAKEASGEVMYISNRSDYLKKVEDLVEETNYVLTKEFKALRKPYGQEEAGKTYKKGSKFVAYKKCGSFLKVKGEGNEVIIGHWISRGAVMEDKNFVVVVKDSITNAAEEAVDFGTDFVGNETTAACNICTRAAVYVTTGRGDTLLFPESGSRIGDAESLYLKGEINDPGRANDIYDDLEASLVPEFYYVPDMEDEDYPDFEQLQDLANDGKIVIGTYRNLGSGSGHIIMIVPGTAEEHTDGKRFLSNESIPLKLPKILECGSNHRQSATPIFDNMSEKKVKKLRWYILTQP